MTINKTFYTYNLILFSWGFVPQRRDIYSIQSDFFFREEPVMALIISGERMTSAKVK